MDKLKHSIKGITWGEAPVILFPLVIYLPMLVSNIFTILICLVAIRAVILKASNPSKGQNIVLFFGVIYGLIILGVFNKVDAGLILSDLEKKLSLLFIPLSIYYTPISKKQYRQSFVLYFYGSAIVASIVIFLFFWSMFFSEGEAYWTNHQLSSLIGFHATYLSIYLLFSLAYPLIMFKRKKLSFVKPLTVIPSLLICIGILLLGVRIAWIILFFFLGHFVFLYLKLPINKGRKYISMLIGVVATFLLIYITPLKQRALEAINYNNEYGTENVWGGRGIRSLIWDSAFSLIKERPLLGYGSSTSVLYALEESYEKNNKGPLLFMMRNGHKFNAHSQYLQEYLKYGLVFGWTYPLFIGYLFWLALKKKNLLALLLTLVIGISSITETVFELNKGIVFITFFTSLVFMKGPLIEEA